MFSPYYYDRALGRRRFKRRYVYAAWGFASGLLAGLLLAQLL